MHDNHSILLLLKNQIWAFPRLHVKVIKTKIHLIMSKHLAYRDVTNVK